MDIDKTLITKKYYLERLDSLLESIEVERGRLSITPDSMHEATDVSLEIATEGIKSLKEFSQTDFIIELKESLIDLWVLSKYLQISMEVILSD